MPHPNVFMALKHTRIDQLRAGDELIEIAFIPTGIVAICPSPNRKRDIPFETQNSAQPLLSRSSSSCSFSLALQKRKDHSVTSSHLDIHTFETPSFYYLSFTDRRGEKNVCHHSHSRNLHSNFDRSNSTQNNRRPPCRKEVSLTVSNTCRCCHPSLLSYDFAKSILGSSLLRSPTLHASSILHSSSTHFNPNPTLKLKLEKAPRATPPATTTSDRPTSLGARSLIRVMDTTYPGRQRLFFWSCSVCRPVSFSFLGCGVFPPLRSRSGGGGVRDEEEPTNVQGAIADSSCFSVLVLLLLLLISRLFPGISWDSARISLFGLPGQPVHVRLGSVGDCVDVVDLDLDIGLDLDLDTAMHSIDFILNKTKHHDNRALDYSRPSRPRHVLEASMDVGHLWSGDDL
jgi:hypothetical protein